MNVFFFFFHQFVYFWFCNTTARLILSLSLCLAFSIAVENESEGGRESELWPEPSMVCSPLSVLCALDDQSRISSATDSHPDDYYPSSQLVSFSPAIIK